jgi:uncharacterized membrane protein
MDADFNRSNDKTYVVSQNPQAEKTLTTIVYALQALSVVTGLPLFVAVIINYIKRNDVKGTWLESHFRWQMRTFWFSLLWSMIALMTIVALIGYVILFAAMIWLIYRIAKGWLNLAEGKAMYTN